MAGQVNQDIDAIGAYPAIHVPVGHAGNISPPMNESHQSAGRIVRLLNVGITVDVELCPVVIFEQRLEEVTDGMGPEIPKSCTYLRLKTCETASSTSVSETIFASVRA